MLPDFSSEPDASMYNLSTPQQCVLFPLELFEDMDNEQVTKSLTTLMGTTVTQLKYTVENGTKHKKMEDGF